MNWKRSLIAIVIVLPIVFLLAYGFQRDPHEIPTPLPGKPAPAFSLETFAPGQGALAMKVGDSISLEGLRGKVVVMNLWASWCLSCRSEHVPLSETARKYAGKPVQFVGVLYQDTPKLALSWIETMGGQSYPSVNDPDSRTAINYGLYGVPETFIIDPNGVVAHKETGPVTEAILSKWIDSLMPKMSVADTALSKKGK